MHVRTRNAWGKSPATINRRIVVGLTLNRSAASWTLTDSARTFMPIPSYVRAVFLDIMGSATLQRTSLHVRTTQRKTRRQIRPHQTTPPHHNTIHITTRRHATATTQQATTLLDVTAHPCTPTQCTTRLGVRPGQCSAAHSTSRRQLRSQHISSLHVTTRRQRSPPGVKAFRSSGDGFNGRSRNDRNISPRGVGRLDVPPLLNLAISDISRNGISRPSAFICLRVVFNPSICFGLSIPRWQQYT